MSYSDPTSLDAHYCSYAQLSPLSLALLLPRYYARAQWGCCDSVVHVRAADFQGLLY